jgi:hypothetical protein
MRIRIRSAHDADPNPAQECGFPSGEMMRIRFMHNDADPTISLHKDADPYHAQGESISGTMMRIRIMHNDADRFLGTMIRIRYQRNNVDFCPAQLCAFMYIKYLAK